MDPLRPAALQTANDAMLNIVFLVLLVNTELWYHHPAGTYLTNQGNKNKVLLRFYDLSITGYQHYKIKLTKKN